MNISIVSKLLSKVRKISNLSRADICSIVSDISLDDFQVLQILSSEFDSYYDIDTIYTNAIPINIKDALSNYSKEVIVALTILVFRDCIQYYKLEMDAFIDEDIEDNSQGYLPPMNLSILDIPKSFKRNNKHLKRDVDILYMYKRQYCNYRYILSLTEFKALKFSEDIILELLGSYEEAGRYLYNQSQIKIQELFGYGYSDEQQVAILLLKEICQINLDLLQTRIPGECKDNILNNKVSVQSRLDAYGKITYTKAITHKDIVVSALVDGDILNKEQMVTLLSKKLPYAMKREDGCEGIYICSDNELRLYVPTEL